MNKLFYIIIAVAMMFLQACSQNSNGIVSKTYHNITARYNAYFLAKEKMKEIETTLETKTQTDYNKILDLYPIYDTNFAKTLNPQFDECIKKASLPIQWHKNSKWVDNSYILIGKCRLYALDYTNAAISFKYVNAKGTDDNDKHEALIYLMRTYLETKEFSYAVDVSNFLANEKLNKNNTREYALTLAYYYQIMGDGVKEAEQLEIAYPLIKKKDFKSRVMFILGQLYQQRGNDEDSYKFYKKVIKNNPPYELAFFSRLYMAQVSSLENNDIKKINKYFVKLLKDEKNLEYKDKIYYEMGKFELKQNKTQAGLDYLKKSVKESTTNAVQKAYSYLKMGEVNYTTLKKYPIAQKYYDSCLVFLPKNHPDYKSIELRSKVLDEFVEQLTIIETGDSLLKLAAMSESSLDKFLDEEIARDIEKQKIAYEYAKKQKKEKEDKEQQIALANGGNTNGGGTNAGDPNAKWYFYNTQLVTLGKAAFDTKWGMRPLEDNWRRSQKETEMSNPNDGTSSAQVANDDSKKNEKEKDEFKPKPLDKTALLKTIPFKQEEKDTMQAKMAKAYFRLGNVYRFKLKEYNNAIETYDGHVKRFIGHEKNPEVLYSKYLTQLTDIKDTAYANKTKDYLLKTYPHSLYSKLILNPNYLTESKEENEKVRRLYRNVYLAYEQKNWTLTDTLAGQLIAQYPDNDINDKLLYIQGIATGQQKNYTKSQEVLNKLVTEYSTSKLKPSAELILGNIKAKLEAPAPLGETLVPENEKPGFDPSKSDTISKDGKSPAVTSPVNSNPESIKAADNKAEIAPNASGTKTETQNARLENKATELEKVASPENQKQQPVPSNK